MGKKKKKTTTQEVFEFFDGWQNFLDTTFQRYTGKTIAQHIQGFVRPPQWPPLEEGKTQVVLDMPLSDAYAILGLTKDASLEDVKSHYRNLVKLFHTDKGGMNDEAMKLINRAHDAILRSQKK